MVRAFVAYISQVFSGLRFRLLILTLLVCAPLVVITVQSALKAREEARKTWQAKAVAPFKVSRDQEKYLSESTGQFLFAMAEQDGIRSGSRAQIKSALEALYREGRRYANIGVTTTNGDVIASLFAPPKKRILSGLHLRRVLLDKDLLTRKLPPRTNSTSPEYIVQFFRPILTSDGSSTGIVFAEFNYAAQGNTKTSRPLDLEGPERWLEFDRSGHVAVVHPANAGRKIGESLSQKDPWLLTNIMSGKSGLLSRAEPHRGRVLYAFNAAQSSLLGTKVAYVLESPESWVVREADQVMWRRLSALGVAMGIMLAIGYAGSHLLILRPVKALAKSSARLAAGELSVRTGLRHSRDELGQLTLAFDQMAQALEQRETERQRVNAKLHALSHRLVEVQESERRHIARELHDEIGQSLTAAQMNLQAAANASDESDRRQSLSESIKAVERVLEQVHDLSLNLRPSMLDDLGLEPALRWYTNRQASLAGFRANFSAEDIGARLDPVVETECFRIAQEALNNVVRHARARNVTVQLSKTNGHLNLCIRDDGLGFDVAALRERAIRGESLGLLSMEERASLAGGGLDMRSVPGEGTEVRAWFPLRPRPTKLLSFSESYD